MDLKKLALQVECIQFDTEDLYKLQNVLNSDVPDIDRQADAVGILNSVGFIDYDRAVRDFVENVDRILSRIRKRRVDFKLQPHGIECLHDLWIDPEPLPYGMRQVEGCEPGVESNQGWKCSTLPGCGTSIHKLYQIRPELGEQEWDRKQYKYHVCNICTFCGTLLTHDDDVERQLAQPQITA